VACFAAYHDASWAYEPCAEMRGRVVENCWSLVWPCCSPYHCHTVAVAAERHCMRDGESRDAEIHDGEIRDATLVGGQEDLDFREQRIGSWD
jgi:hypothetical protein